MALLKILNRLFGSRKEPQAVSYSLEEVPAQMKYLVACLGNIGSEYACTRHNMGFMVADHWAAAKEVAFKTERYGDVACIREKGRQYWLLKPSTYMNLSGNAVRYWLGKLGIPRENLIVICDDLNLPFGAMRMRTQGSDGGHNGLKNIIELLGDSNFTRIRMGIGNDFSKGEQVDFVLGKLSDEEIEQVGQMAKKIESSIKCYAFEGSQKAMTLLNTSPKTY